MRPYIQFFSALRLSVVFPSTSLQASCASEAVYRSVGRRPLQNHIPDLERLFRRFDAWSSRRRLDRSSACDQCSLSCGSRWPAAGSRGGWCRRLLVLLGERLRHAPVQQSLHRLGINILEKLYIQFCMILSIRISDPNLILTPVLIGPDCSYAAAEVFTEKRTAVAVLDVLLVSQPRKSHNCSILFSSHLKPPSFLGHALKSRLTAVHDLDFIAYWA